jgi:succinate dehydrogenase/fumarate reductase flavoprotein subunit
MGPWKEVNRPGGPYDFRKSGGYKAAKHLESLLEQAGATILYETAAHRFIIDEKGEVNGLVVKGPDGIYTLNSHNIILCTGGFPFNQEMVSRYIGPRAGSWVASGTPFNTGDGHRMALEVGAAMRNMNSFYATIEPLEALKDSGLRMSFSMWGSRGTHGIVVNERGERFVDESWGRHGISHVMAKETRLNIRFLMVFDRTEYEQSKELLDGLSGFGVTIHQAGSVEELIEKTGVSPYLATTLKEFNQAVETGTVHELSVPKTGMVRTISSPPYFGIWCMPGTPYTHGGPQINGNAEIVDLDGRVIPGLYGAGDLVSGNLSGGEENRFGSYCGGISGAIWGLLAAEHSRERTQKA